MANRWLVKTEPGTFSFEDLVRAKRTRWDGVSNPVAVKHLRAMRTGDDVLVYHTGSERSVVGLARVSADPAPEPELEAVRPLAPVSLATIKANETLADWALVRQGRLSVMPVPPEAWKAIVGR
jgi:predicted RNA-binding protein with PUA-like domain